MGPDITDQAMSAHSSLAATSASFIPMPSVPVTDQVGLSIGAMTVSTTSEMTHEEIHSKLESLYQENVQLKETLHQNNLAMKKQFNTLVMWQEDVMKVHQSHKEKFEETKKLISHLRAENTELKKSVSLPSASTLSVTKSSDDLLGLKSKISALEFELDTLRQANIKYKQDQAKLVQDLEIKITQTENSKQEEIAKLTHDCKIKLAAYEDAKKQDITKLNLVVDSLKAQLHTVEEQLVVTQQKLVDVSAKMPSDQDLREAETNKRQNKEFATELLLKNKVLLEKTELIDNLHEEVCKLKIENETIPILKTQVDVYQADFNQERDARNQLKEEKERIADDLRHLQRRNQQLLEEVEKYQEGFVHVQNQQQSQQSSVSQQSREQSPPLATFTCPLCNSRHRTLRALEEHVDTCLQNSA
ncbi:hypothetical protein CBL_04368 [Carabus blaptoides fortunei]